VRALSTALLVLALASPAGAQVFGAPRDYNRNFLWLSAGRGNMSTASVSDEASGGSWLLEKSKPVQVAIDWGRSTSSVGVTVREGKIPMRFGGTKCSGCNAQVQALVVMGTYRRAASLFGSSLLQITELAAGTTRWSGLSGRNGDPVPAVAANNDFTYSLGIGVGLPVGQSLEVSLMYDVMKVYHERAPLGAADKASSAFVGLSTLRAGARIRLFK
jgi:hypothetical protein